MQKGGQRTQKVNSLIDVLYNKLRIRKEEKKKDRKLRKVFD